MPETFTVTLDGAMLRRGFYLYVWEIAPPKEDKVLYVGRTGDSSSPNAQSLFNRLGQNLGTLATSSMAARKGSSNRARPGLLAERLEPAGSTATSARARSTRTTRRSWRSRGTSSKRRSPPGTSPADP